MLTTNIVIGVFLARQLGPENYGVYAFFISLIALLGLPSAIGIPNLVLREIPYMVTGAQWDRLKGLIIWSFASILILSLLVMIGSLLAGTLVGIEVIVDNRTCLLLALLLLPLLSFQTLLINILRGLHFSFVSQLPVYIKQIGFLILLITIFVYIPDLVSPGAALIINISITLCAVIAGFIAVFKLMPEKSKLEKPLYTTQSWIKSTIPFALMLGLQIINNRADALMLGLLRPTAEVAYYDVAMRTAELVLFLQVTVNMAIAPNISRLYAESKKSQLCNMITKSVRFSLLITLPVISIILIYGEQLIEFVFGQAYTAAIFAMYILIIGHCINLFFGPNDLMLNMCKKEKYTVRGVALAAVINIALNLYLIPLYGVEGACISTLVSTLMWNIMLYASTVKHLGIDTSFLGIRYANQSA